MRQVIYASTALGASAAELSPGILRQSRVQNGIDGITGLLCARGDQFLQLLEGPEESVALTLARIFADPRHHEVELLSDRTVEERDFGDWSMAFRDRREPRDLVEERLRVTLAGVPDELADRFREFYRA